MSNDDWLSRKFWEKVIISIEFLIFISMAFLLYAIASKLTNSGIDIGPITGIVFQILFTIFIIYANKNFMAELNRRFPIQKRWEQD